MVYEVQVKQSKRSFGLYQVAHTGNPMGQAEHDDTQAKKQRMADEKG
jgi:hypothetical protein